MFLVFVLLDVQDFEVLVYSCVFKFLCFRVEGNRWSSAGTYKVSIQVFMTCSQG